MKPTWNAQNLDMNRNAQSLDKTSEQEYTDLPSGCVRVGGFKS